ncbi:hypothetical protein PFISCL1PPCAC_9226 [Pristionchus fissidentatus]|uniref:Uncharacterized protein n=1 Tax=Pristionchus fissidentatus TaxID=1538716 RepID=A0AAV5VES1_9BILA|nr:hypothetical protein PFISCL1PPCAC_9226 [Pristionchus fissidentatus]
MNRSNRMPISISSLLRSKPASANMGRFISTASVCLSQRPERSVSLHCNVSTNRRVSTRYAHALTQQRNLFLHQYYHLIVYFQY